MDRFVQFIKSPIGIASLVAFGAIAIYLIYKQISGSSATTSSTTASTAIAGTPTGGGDTSWPSGAQAEQQWASNAPGGGGVSTVTTSTPPPATVTPPATPPTFIQPPTIIASHPVTTPMSLQLRTAGAIPGWDSTHSYVPIRSSPNGNASIIGTPSFGGAVTLVSPGSQPQNGYYQVYTQNGQVGWLSQTDVAPAKS